VNVLGALENGLFALGQVLRFPVIVLLWASVAFALFLAGACAVEFVARRRERAGFDLNRWLRSGAVLDGDASRRSALPAALRALVSDVDALRSQGALGAGGLEHALLSREERIKRQLAAPRMLVKVGPSLGLLGTLIPMGGSLASLASGNLEAMAGQMVVAFTTTIVGLAVGTLAYIVAVVRQGWTNQLVHEQRYLAERMASELERVA
jgi:biopolymer transport protein ExbB/TolQ